MYSAHVGRACMRVYGSLFSPAAALGAAIGSPHFAQNFEPSESISPHNVQNWDLWRCDAVREARTAARGATCDDGSGFGSGSGWGCRHCGGGGGGVRLANFDGTAGHSTTGGVVLVTLGTACCCNDGCGVEGGRALPANGRAAATTGSETETSGSGDGSGSSSGSS